MDLSVVTVTWNSAKYIADQIKSVVLSCQGLVYEQIIIDNASSDDTVPIIVENFPNVKLIKSETNLGFANGYNTAIKSATGKYFLYLNPDMRLVGSIAPLVDFVNNHPEVGIVSGQLVDENKQINLAATPRRFPRWWEVVAIFFKLPHIFPNILNNYLYHDRDWSEIQAVDSVRGAFMLVRYELVNKLGFAFDPRYFLWWEDVDLCRETRRLGYQVVYNPVTVCIDHVGRSFSRRAWLKKQWMFFGGVIKYFRKWRISN